MSGIYIPEMEMPSSCIYCPLSRYGCGESCALTDCGTQEDARRDDCPLIPVPPHGRLIDADAMLMRINHEVMEAYMDGVCYGVHPSQEYLYLLGEIIDDAPTIIPAEEGETLGGGPDGQRV